jgi:hypothetical protein
MQVVPRLAVVAPLICSFPADVPERLFSFLLIARQKARRRAVEPHAWISEVANHNHECTREVYSLQFVYGSLQVLEPRALAEDAANSAMALCRADGMMAALDSR